MSYTTLHASHNEAQSSPPTIYEQQVSVLRNRRLSHSRRVPTTIKRLEAIILSPLTSKEGWSYTCPKCPWNPPKDPNDVEDYVRVVRTDPNHPKYGYLTSINLKYPKRCNSCEAAKKRNSRLGRSIARVFGMSAGIGSFYPSYNYPKLITFALLHDYYSTNDPIDDRTRLVKELNSKLPGAIKLLKSKGTLGGTFVLECSTKLIWSDLATEPQMWRHHPHVHMVAVSNFVHWKKLVDYCAMLIPLGLGRINLKAPRSSKPVARYIGKYLAKDGFRARTFGIMRKVPKWERQCFCKHDDMSVNATFCDCIIGGS